MPENVTTPDQTESSSVLTLDGLHSRRSFLKKAGLGTAAVAAVWAVPQVTSVGKAQAAYSAITGPCLDKIIDFEEFDKGDVVTSTMGIAVTATSNNNTTAAANTAVVFDTNDYSGGDDDLDYSGYDGGSIGKVLILQENADDGLTGGVYNDPDDDRRGGCIEFLFPELVRISTVRLLDIESTSTYVEAFSDEDCTNSLKKVFAPANGNNEIDVLSFDIEGIKCLKVSFNNSGAIAEINCPCPRK